MVTPSARFAIVSFTDRVVGTAVTGSKDVASAGSVVGVGVETEALFSDAGIDVHPAENRVHIRIRAKHTIARTGVYFFIIIRHEK
jgi:IS5 family transposase